MNNGYFDWAATSFMSEAACDAYRNAASAYPGNPSSLHKLGSQASTFLNACRSTVAALLHISPDTVFFTAGGTESNSIAILSRLWRKSPGKIIFSNLEHDSVLQHRRILEEHGFAVLSLTSKKGYADLDHLDTLLDEQVDLVCLLLAQNVLGTVQDVASAVALVRAHERRTGKRIHVHCDAVQALGKVSFDLASLGVDSAAFSAHKFQGPRGVGVLYCRPNSIEALSRGGGQESGLRPGTEHIAGIAAMTEAMSELFRNFDERMLHVHKLRRFFEDSWREHPVIVQLSPYSNENSRIVDSIVTISLPCLPSEVAMRILSDRGLYVSSGSACSNNAKKKSSRLFQDFGFNAHVAGGAIRISFGPTTTIEECAMLVQALQDIAKQYGTTVKRG
ncbi:MAG: aminotransferase class V-fold PLP-dependent enzyme [Sphaerochaetaceae bacterium]|nr:aminotransferase class V-fold PLP-dependent enzyme [Spirochaetales bacterium]